MVIEFERAMNSNKASKLNLDNAKKQAYRLIKY